MVIFSYEFVTDRSEMGSRHRAPKTIYVMVSYVDVQPIIRPHNSMVKPGMITSGRNYAAVKESNSFPAAVFV